VPAVGWLRHYRRAWLRGDVVAALTTWALVVPQAIAYAQIAGLPPQAGLFAAFAGLLGYGLFGTCRQLIVSPTSSTAAISAAIVAPVALGDPERYAAASAALAMLVGVVLIALGLLRMGFVSRFIAAGVQVGFMFGLGLTIIVGQLPKLLGVPPGDGTFFGQAADLLGHLGDTNGWTAAIGLGSLAVLLGLKRVAPAVPAALAVVVAGIALVALFDLSARGVEVIGSVDGGVPLPAIPSVSWHDLLGLLPGAVAVAIIGYAESATVAESMGTEHGYDVEPDRELRAVGIANILSGLFQGFITGGGASQTAANDRAGAQTQLVSLLVAGLTVVTTIALLPLFRDLPQAALGAVVISAVVGFLNLAAMGRVRRLRRDSFVIALVAMVAVLALGVLQGLILAVVVSVGVFLIRSSRPSSSVLGRVPGTTRLRGPRARAAGLPAERAAAVRQRQAPPRRHPGRARRRRPPGQGGPARPVVHPRARHRERQRARLAPFRAGAPGRRPVAGRGPRPGAGDAGPQRPGRPDRPRPPVPGRRGRGHGEVTSGSPGGSGSRRTSTSSRPRAWMRSSSP
jgi:sulfate permease, SulP family